jgi:hypothetical protein
MTTRRVQSQCEIAAESMITWRNRRQIEAGELACRLLNLYFEQRSGAFLCGDQQVRKRKPAKPLICWWVRCGSALNANWLGNSFALPLPPVATEAQSTPLALAGLHAQRVLRSASHLSLNQASPQVLFVGESDCIARPRL